ncbi:CHAT domain-containing tetratricopeptide repeat protein [Microcoleus sp. CAWBG556]|uniref:CHAT domain-containing tetratricopeptide repeat protein n=1 Tax=Microcoleus sp. CAWBG556 TaxID=2841650 RepID=UPI0025EE0CBC|nr:CHAT domain-containing tetratricopeptide repeat protein [Microcoleus sp. CAWBG556]
MRLINWLLNFASQLPKVLEILSSLATRAEYFIFLVELLKVEGEIDENPQAVDRLLQRHLNKLDMHFPQILQEVATGLISQDPENAELIVVLIENISLRIQEFPLGNIADNQEIAIAGHAVVLQNCDENTEKWATTQNNLGSAYNNRIKGDKADNIELAIAAYTKALQVYTPQAFPQGWAMTQNNLGTAYWDKIKGDKADNIELAIAAYTKALQVYTPQAFPQHWATTQNNLGSAYNNRIKGDKADNIELAIAVYTKALQVYTPQAFPQGWAMTQNNLGTAYWDRIKGDKADNIELAIAAYTQALQVYTPQAFPQHWATTQNNLGAAYSNKIKGDKADNIELAIAACTKALQVYTPQAFPQDWAMTQNNLGAAYSDRIKGDKADNIELAIAAFTKALQVRTTQALPYDLAQTQNNLGNAYCKRIKGDKADNIELAIEAYTNALQVYTPQAFPQHWATTQNNLGAAYLHRIKGDKADNIELAIEAYTKALQVYTPQAFPQDWAGTQNNLGNAYLHRIKGDKADNIEFAIAAYTLALQVLTPQAFPQYWAMTQNNLGNAYCKRIKGDKADNIEFAIAAYTQALQIYTPEAFPQNWAMTQNNLGLAYNDRIKGDKADNIELAIAAYTHALQVRTPEAFPQDWAMTQNNLGAAYSDRIKGDKAENIELAIASYTLALQIYTPEAFPIDCLRTSSNLGNLAFDIENWQLAIESYEKAIASVERSRNWATTDKRRHEILKEAIGVYYRMVQACINNGQLDKALEYSERSRSKTLGDIMASNRYFEQGEIDLELKQAWQKYDDLQQQINLLTLAYQTAETQLAGTRRIATPESLQADEEAIEQLETEKQQTWQELRRRDPVLAGQLQVDPLNLSQIQRLIDNNKTALLSFYTTENDTHIFILLKDRSPQLFTCEGQGLEVLQSWLWKNWLIPYVEFRNTGNWEWKDKMGSVLAELSGRLQVNELIAKYLNGIEELIIVPHLMLHQIPFAALPVGDPPQPPLKRGGQEASDACESLLPCAEASDPPQPPLKRGGQEASDACESLLPNAEAIKIPPVPPLTKGGLGGDLSGQEASDACESLLPNAEAIKIPPVPPLTKGGLGGVLSTNCDSTRGISIPKPQPKTQPTSPPTQYLGDKFRLRVVPSCQILSYCHDRPPLHAQLIMGIVEDATEDLPFTRYECETLAKTYQIPSTRRLQGKDATIDSVKHLLRQVQILHTSHHAASNLNEPLESALQLADGNLKLGQLLSPGWRMPDLSDAFTCNCETHFSVTDVTDEILTLSVGFLCAGARSVVSTLWSVEDLASAMLSLFYYQGREAGLSRSLALQKAQQNLRNLTGKEFAARYQSALEKHLEELHAAIMEKHRGVVNENESQKLLEAARKIEAQQRRLEGCAKEDLPFNSPYYWAGFVSQGLS